MVSMSRMWMAPMFIFPRTLSISQPMPPIPMMRTLTFWSCCSAEWIKFPIRFILLSASMLAQWNYIYINREISYRVFNSCSQYSSLIICILKWRTKAKMRGAAERAKGKECQTPSTLKESMSSKDSRNPPESCRNHRERKAGDISRMKISVIWMIVQMGLWVNRVATGTLANYHKMEPQWKFSLFLTVVPFSSFTRCIITVSPNLSTVFLLLCLMYLRTRLSMPFP